ncbi:MAG: YwaF family protein [Clostridia bacterium]|nr:YwaF family protein [Clostridia bacterium]
MGLWTTTHAITLIPAIAVMILAAAILRKAIGDKPLKIRMIPYQVLACIIVALEIGKQLVSFSRGYDLYHIPLHFCSLFIFTMPVMAFYNGKHKNTVTAITSAISASLFLLMLIYPNLIYGEWNVKNFFVDFLDFHTVAFHNIVMFAFLLIVFLGLHTPDTKKDPKAALLFILCFCVVSSTMAQILKTNYANYYTCNIPALEEVRVSLQGVIGVVPTQILYIIIVSVLNLLFVLMSYWIYYLLNCLFGKKAAKEQTA